MPEPKYAHLADLFVARVEDKTKDELVWQVSHLPEESLEWDGDPKRWFLVAVSSEHRAALVKELDDLEGAGELTKSLVMLLKAAEQDRLNRSL